MAKIDFNGIDEYALQLTTSTRRSTLQLSPGHRLADTSTHDLHTEVDAFADLEGATNKVLQLTTSTRRSTVVDGDTIMLDGTSTHDLHTEVDR